MEYSAPLRRAIAEKNIDLARAAIVAALDEDSRKEEPCGLALADEVAAFFTDPAEPFYEKEDNEWLSIPPQREWDEAFWNRVKGALGLNFSKERIQLATKVMLYLRKQGEPHFQPVKREQPSSPQRAASPEPRSTRIGAGIKQQRANENPGTLINFTRIFKTISQKLNKPVPGSYHGIQRSAQTSNRRKKY